MKLQRNLCPVSVRVLPVKVLVLCLIVLLFPVSYSFTPLDSVLKGALSHRYVGLMPRVFSTFYVRLGSGTPIVTPHPCKPGGMPMRARLGPAVGHRVG